jgi:hypothetical protein
VVRRQSIGYEDDGRTVQLLKLTDRDQHRLDRERSFLEAAADNTGETIRFGLGRSGISGAKTMAIFAGLAGLAARKARDFTMT